MGKILLLSLTVFAANAFAGSVTITSNEATQKPELLEVPQQLIGMLAGYERPLVDMGNGIFKVEIKDLNCVTRGNTGLGQSDPLAGVPVQSCTVSAQAVEWGTALSTLLARVETASNRGVLFTDCTLGGNCTTLAKSIACTVDTKIVTMLDGRFACTLTDAQ